MYSTCHYWSRTLPGRGKWTTKLCQSQKRNSRLETTRIMRSKQSSTARCTANRQTIKCQASTTLFRGKATQKKKILGSPHRQLYTSGNWSTPSIRSIRKSQQRPLHPWTLLHQWPGQRFQNKSRNKSAAVQAKEPISEAESSALCGPRFRYRAQAFDSKASSLS